MEAFMEHMAITCLIGAIVMAILGGWCWLGEKIIDKFWDRDKFVEFLFGPMEEDFEDEN